MAARGPDSSDEERDEDEHDSDGDQEEDQDPTGLESEEERIEYARQLYKRAPKIHIPETIFEQSKTWTYLRPLLLHCAARRIGVPLNELLYDNDGDADEGPWSVVHGKLQQFLACLNRESYLTEGEAKVVDAEIMLPLITERELYLYLRDWMLPHYQRRTRGQDTTPTSSANMIEQTIQGAQKIGNLEDANLLYLLKKRREEKSVRSHRVLLIKKKVELAKSKTRRLTGQDPTIGTAAQTINNDKVKRMSDYVLSTGTVSAIRCFTSLLFCFACCLRHISFEKVVQPNLYLDMLGDKFFEAAGQRTYEMAALVIDKSKENLLGHKQISGAIHARDLFRCPVWFLACYLVVIKFVIWGQSYPDFDDDSSWMNHHILQTESKVNTNEGMSDKEVRCDYHSLYENALGMSKEDIAQHPLRHGGRHLAVLTMCKGGVPALDQNDFGMWGDIHSRRNNNYAWNVICSSAAFAVAGTPCNASAPHESPYRKIDVPDSLAAFFFDAPFKWDKKWKGGARPKKNCCFSFNNAVIMLTKTFIQGLPIILRRYEAEILGNPMHILNHESIVCLKENPEYQRFAKQQLEAYDAALLPVAHDQANLDSILAAQHRQAISVDLLLRQQSQNLANHGQLEVKIDKIALDIVRVSQMLEGLSTSTDRARRSGGENSNEATASSSPFVQTSAPHTSGTGGRTRLTENNVNRLISHEQLLEYENAIEFLPSLETLNRMTEHGRQFGMQQIVTFYLVGNKQKDGLTHFPSMEFMDRTYGDRWVSKIKRPAVSSGVKIVNLRNRAHQVRVIFEYIKSRIPSSASNSFLQNALEQASLLDAARSKQETLSSWWDRFQSDQAQLKKARELEADMHGTNFLTDKQKSHMLSLLSSVHNLVEQSKTTERSNKGKGSRTEKLSLDAMKKAEKQYSEYLSASGAPEAATKAMKYKKRKNAEEDASDQAATPG
jgi:hypothetical protein